MDVQEGLARVQPEKGQLNILEKAASVPPQVCLHHLHYLDGLLLCCLRADSRADLHAGSGFLRSGIAVPVQKQVLNSLHALLGHSRCVDFSAKVHGTGHPCGQFQHHHLHLL